MSLTDSLELISLPNFSESDSVVLKKYFEFNKKYYVMVNEELTSTLRNHPLWGPILSMRSPEETLASQNRSQEMQRSAIYDGKWEDYARELVTQGKMYARMNVAYADWYEIIRMYKVFLVPHIKNDFKESIQDAIDFIDGLTKFLDYAMYGIAEAYFQEKNAIILENEERFRAIFENSADHIFLLDGAGIIQMINHVVKGIDKKDIIGKSIYDIQHKSNLPIIKNAIETVFGKRIPVRYETIRIIEGVTRHFSSTASPIFNKDGSVRIAVVIAREITEQKIAQAEIQELNATLESRVQARTEELNSINQELESFSYSISHDLRGPLRAISGFTQILAEETPADLNDDAKDAMAEIISNAARMGHLIDDLLEFSRLGKQHVSKVTVDMNELVNSVINDLKKEGAGSITKFTVHTLPPAMADHGMIKQVFMNIISNAIKYSAKKSQPEIEIGFSSNGTGNAFYVNDNGAGFDMAYYEKLFGVFQRLHRTDEFEGTGVGLAIVQRIIAKHGGKVWAEGKINEGATFYFSLPIN